MSWAAAMDPTCTWDEGLRIDDAVALDCATSPSSTPGPVAANTQHLLAAGVAPTEAACREAAALHDDLSPAGAARAAPLDDDAGGRAGDPPSSLNTAAPAPAGHFHCVPLRCTLTRSSCASRRVAARERVRRFPNASGVPLCLDCQIGAAHGRGDRPTRWPDGSPIVELAAPTLHASVPAAARVRALAVNVQPPLPLARRDEEEPVPPPNVHTYKGQKRTTAELATLAGCATSVMKARLRRVSAEEAVAMGAALPQGHNRARGPGAASRATQAAAATEKKRQAPAPKQQGPSLAASDATADAVRSMLAATDPAVLLERLGYEVTTVGRAPNGAVLIAVRSPAIGEHEVRV